MNEYDSNFEFPVIDDGTEFDWDSLFQPQTPTAPVVTLNPAKKMSVVQTKKNGEQAIIAKDRAKNKASCRSLPLVPQFRELLLKMKAHQQYCAELCGDCYTHSDYIFVNDIGQPYNPNYITQHFALILEKNNLRKIRYHELRHPYVKHTTKKYNSAKAEIPNYQRLFDSLGFLFLYLIL